MSCEIFGAGLLGMIEKKKRGDKLVNFTKSTKKFINKYWGFNEAEVEFDIDIY